MKGAGTLVLLAFLIPSAVHAKDYGVGQQGKVRAPFIVTIGNAVPFYKDGKALKTCNTQKDGTVRVVPFVDDKDVTMRELRYRPNGEVKEGSCPS